MTFNPDDPLEHSQKMAVSKPDTWNHKQLAHAICDVTGFEDVGLIKMWIEDYVLELMSGGDSYYRQFVLDTIASGKLHERPPCKKPE